MEPKHELSNILTSINRPTTDMHVVRRRFWEKLMTDILSEREVYLDDRETTIAILNSHNAEIKGFVRNFPILVPNS